MRRGIVLLVLTLVAGCSSDATSVDAGRDASDSTHACAAAAAALTAMDVTCAAEVCATAIPCAQSLGDCRVPLHRCQPDHADCVDHHVVVERSSAPCDAGPPIDAPFVLPDSGTFCDELFPQLAMSGADQCPTYCPTSIPCGQSFRCELAPYGCNERWAACSDGRVVVSTTGIACDAGTPDAAWLDAGGVHSCEEAWAMIGPHPCVGAPACDAGIACDGFTRCFECPYWLTCDASGALSVEMTLLPCDAGPPPSDAGVDAP